MLYLVDIIVSVKNHRGSLWHAHSMACFCVRFSFFPLTDHSVSTLQVLCPYLANEEKESLVALCVAELLNWQDRESDCIDSEIFILHTLHMMSHVDWTSPIMLNWTDVCVGVRVCLAVLHCCLQADTAAEEEILLAVVATMAEWRNSREEWFLFNRCVCAFHTTHDLGVVVVLKCLTLTVVVVMAECFLIVCILLRMYI